MNKLLTKIKREIAIVKSELSYIDYRDLKTDDYDRVVLSYNTIVDLQDLINETLEAKNAKE
jgi:hypothetical protein